MKITNAHSWWLLLLAVPDTEAAGLITALHDQGVQAAIKIGKVAEGAPEIMVT